MSKEIVLALDAMGGDKAPEMVIKGANMARVRHPNLRFEIFGDQKFINPLLNRFKRLKAICNLHHTVEQVEDDIRPSKALRQRRNSGMSLAVEAVRTGGADGVVSAGNTGALMAFSKLSLRTLPGINRPAMVSVFPTERGECVMLDLGANIECDSITLVQFAMMGEVFARNVLGVQHPTVGLLNIGSEELKGNETIRQAAAMLREANLPIDFTGFVEGNDIPAGTVDVVVTDGFAGNVALKTAEGVAKMYIEYMRSAFRRSLLSRIGFLLARPALRALRDRVDPRAYNGGTFLGLNGVAVKSHGGTDHKGFANALSVAVDMIEHDVNPKIIEELKRLSFDEVPETQKAAG